MNIKEIIKPKRRRTTLVCYTCQNGHEYVVGIDTHNDSSTGCSECSSYAVTARMIYVKPDKVMDRLYKQRKNQIYKSTGKSKASVRFE